MNYSLEQLADAATRCLTSIGQTWAAGRVKIERDYLDGQPAITFGGFAVYQITEDTAETPDQVGKWALEGSKVIHGCHTMRNGDPGYPDNVDTSVVAVGDQPIAMIEQGVKMVAAEIIDGCLTSWGEIEFDRSCEAALAAGQ